MRTSADALRAWVPTRQGLPPPARGALVAARRIIMSHVVSWCGCGCIGSRSPRATLTCITAGRSLRWSHDPADIRRLVVPCCCRSRVSPPRGWPHQHADGVVPCPCRNRSSAGPLWLLTGNPVASSCVTRGQPRRARLSGDAARPSRGGGVEQLLTEQVADGGVAPGAGRSLGRVGASAELRQTSAAFARRPHSGCVADRVEGRQAGAVRAPADIAWCCAA